MNKPSLTPAGVKQKIKALYSLEDSALLAQAALVSIDVVTWIVDNFELTVSQYDYLISLAPPFITVFNEKVSRAMSNRWTIDYMPGMPAEEIVSAHKVNTWIKCKEESTAGNNITDDFYYGSLTILTGKSYQ